MRTTAAAFAKGCLDVEGEHLTPIMVSMVHCHRQADYMLDNTSKAMEMLKNVKDSYADTLECDRSPTDEYCVCFTQTTEGKVVCTEGKGADIASMSAVEKRGR